MRIECSNKDNYKRILLATWSQKYLQHTQVYLKRYLMNLGDLGQFCVQLEVGNPPGALCMHA